MADFWENLLSSRGPVEAPVPAPAQQQPWWQRPVAPAPTPGPMPSPEPVQDQRQPDLSRMQATNDRCPSCGGQNYFAHPEYPNARPRCFECGYPAPQQSGSGVSLKGKHLGPVQAARQTEASKTNSFNPQNVFMHM